MAVNSRKLLALDTNVLMDMGRDEDWSHDFREAFQRLGYRLLIPPTVVAELATLAELGSPDERRAAETALRSMERSWGIKPFTLSSVHEAIALQFARRLIEQGSLPVVEECDGIILAETSLGEIPMLATSDNHLLSIDDIDLKLAFDDADLEVVAVASPRRLLKALR